MQLLPVAAPAAPVAAFLFAAASIAPATYCPPGTIVHAAVFTTDCTTLFLATPFTLPKRPPPFFFLPDWGAPAESGAGAALSGVAMDTAASGAAAVAAGGSWRWVELCAAAVDAARAQRQHQPEPAHRRSLLHTILQCVLGSRRLRVAPAPRDGCADGLRPWCRGPASVRTVLACIAMRAKPGRRGRDTARDFVKALAGREPGYSGRPNRRRCLTRRHRSGRPSGGSRCRPGAGPHPSEAPLIPTTAGRPGSPRSAGAVRS